MPTENLTIKTLWREMEFKPTQNQRDAILHLDGPLYLLAGPGSGKTRVLDCIEDGEFQPASLKVLRRALRKKEHQIWSCRLPQLRSPVLV